MHTVDTDLAFGTWVSTEHDLDFRERGHAMPASTSAFYLFSDPSGAEGESPSTVFCRVVGESLAKSLCQLFTREYTDGSGRPAFRYSEVGSVSLAERVLLDEAIDLLSVYQDPDPGLYEPPPSQHTLFLAQWAMRAETWEYLLRRQSDFPEQSETPAPIVGSHGKSDALDGLSKMSPEDSRNSGLILLMLLAQAYYMMLESVMSVASWVASLGRVDN